MSATISISDDLAALLAGVFSTDDGNAAVAELPPPVAPPSRVVDTSTTQEQEPQRRRSSRAPYRGPRRRGYINWQKVERLTIAEANGELAIQFPNKPSEQIRAMLHETGFKFSGYNGKWTHEANAATRGIADRVRAMCSLKNL